jgi:hypothetical protein
VRRQIAVIDVLEMQRVDYFGEEYQHLQLLVLILEYLSLMQSLMQTCALMFENMDFVVFTDENSDGELNVRLHVQQSQCSQLHEA